MKIILKDYKAQSLNKIYAQGHWSKRARLLRECHFVTKNALDKLKWIPYTSKVNIKVVAHLKRAIDSDNISVKGIIDSFKICGLIKDDTPKYVDEVTTKSVKDTHDWTEIFITKA